MKRKFKNKEFYLPILLLAIIFIIKLIQFSKIVSYFPLRHDIPSHIANLYFLVEYGFHGFVPNWYNGFTLFEFYPPGYYFFTFPIYLLSNNFSLSTYISLIISFVLGFIGILIFGKTQRISFIRSIALFLFFFANSIFINFFYEIGRLASVFTWLVIFIPFCIIVFWYKDHNIDYKFSLFIIFLSLLILSHTFVFIMSSLLILSLFLIKNKKEKIFILLSVLLSLIITSFWWIPFVKFTLSINHLENFLAREILQLKSFVSYSTILIFILWFTIYFYLKYKNSLKEYIFFTPYLILSILFFTRLIIFIPLFNRVPAGEYNIIFLFLSLFLFFKTDYSIYPIIIKKIIPLVLLILAISSVIITFNMLFLIEHNETEEEMISILPQVHEKFIVLSEKEFFIDEGLATYAAIYYNLLTPAGHHFSALAKKEVLETFKELNKNLESKNCKDMIYNLKKLEVKEIISAKEHCDFLTECGIKEKIKKEHACLFYLNY